MTPEATLPELQTPDGNCPEDQVTSGLRSSELVQIHVARIAMPRRWRRRQTSV